MKGKRAKPTTRAPKATRGEQAPRVSKPAKAAKARAAGTKPAKAAKARAAGTKPAGRRAAAVRGAAADGLTLCTLNLAGIRSAERKGFLRWLEARRPDVLSLQELRAHEEQVPDAVRSPPGYNTRWCCAEKRGYSGVALYSRRAADRYNAGLELVWGDREGRVLLADYADVTVVSLYVPSGTTGEVRQRAKIEFLQHLAPWLERLLKGGRPVAVCGDVNIAPTELDIHDPRRNARSSGFLPEERAWFAKVLSQGWVDALRAAHPGEPGLYSWWSHRGRAREEDKGWRIDHVLLSPELAERLEDAWIEKDAALSDHAPVWVRLSG